jgi:uncharacterized membrane protein
MKKSLSFFLTLNVWIILAVAVVLRLPNLGGSFWLDEAAQALESTRPFNQQLQIAEDFQPPLLHLLVHFAAQVSQTEVWLRIWGALLPGLVTIYATYKIAEVVFSKKVAVVAALLLATSSFHIFYSQELRPYSLSAALAALSWLLLVRVCYSKKEFSGKYILGYTLATALGLYSTYLYPFVVLSQASYIFWKERQYLKPYVLSTVIAGLLFIPWVPYLLEQLHVGQNLRQSLPGWEAVVSIPQLKSLPLTFGKFLFGVLNIEITSFFIITTGIFLISICFAVWRIRQLHLSFYRSRELALLTCWLLLPLIVSWLTSFILPIVQPKRLLYLLPAFYMSAVAVVLQSTLLQYKQKTIHLLLQQTIAPLAIAILFLLNITSLIAYSTNPLYQRENWRLLHQQILERYPRESVVVFAFDAAFAPWQWYDDGSYPVVATGSLTTASQGEVTEQLKKTSDYSYILVFDYLRDLTDRERKIETALQDLGFSEREVFGLPGIGFVRVFARQDGVLS